MGSGVIVGIRRGVGYGIGTSSTCALRARRDGVGGGKRRQIRSRSGHTSPQFGHTVGELAVVW